LEPTRCSRNLPSFIHDLRSFFENNPEINRTIYKRQAATALAIVAHMTKVSLCNFVGANLAQAIEGVIKNNTLLRNYLRISAPYFLTGVGVVNAAGYLYDKKNHKTTQQNISGRTLSLLLTVAVTGVLIFESTKDDPLIDSLIAEIFGQVFGYHIPRDLALDQFILTKDNSDKRYPSAAVASSGAYGLSKGGIQVIVQALAALNVSAEQVDAISSVLSGMVDGGCSIFKGRLNYYQDRGTCKGWRMSATLQRPSRQSLARALLTRLPAHVIRSLAPAIIWYVIDQQCLGNLSAEERQRWHDVLHDGLICLLYMISQLSYDLTNS
jgi:hypothetical protein